MSPEPQRLDYARPESRPPGPLKRLSAYCLIIAGFCSLGVAGAILYAVCDGHAPGTGFDTWDLAFITGATVIGGTLISAGFYMRRSRGKG